MNKEIIKEVKKFVEEESRKPTSNYGYDTFEFHFKSTAKHAKKLAEEMGADKEIVTIGAWLHDIGSMMHGREDHHVTGPKIAERKLKELDYPEEKIELVKKCIRNHRGSQDNQRETLEEKIVAEADTMSNFNQIGGIFKGELVGENKDQLEAEKSALEKLQNKWKKLHFEKSKELIKPKYEAVMTLLSKDQSSS